jgi:uncharacterized MnhB-related membrane protein
VTAFQAVLLILLAAAGTVVVLTRTPRKQVIAMSFYGLLLSLLFLAIQAPDVALSQLAVGAVAVPLMLLVALANVRRELHK